MSGKVVHFEIPYEDGDRARAFYRDAFGWDVLTMPEMGGYTLVTTGPSSQETGPTEPGFINGGMFGRGESASPHPVVVVDVPDIDAALTQIEQLGGKTLVARTAVGDMGFSAYFTDTEGNITGLWETAPQG